MIVLSLFNSLLVFTQKCRQVCTGDPCKQGVCIPTTGSKYTCGCPVGFTGSPDCGTLIRKRLFLLFIYRAIGLFYPSFWFIILLFEILIQPATPYKIIGEYLGCYNDRNDVRDLNSKKFFLNNPATGMTVEKCFVYCFNLNYQYSGTRIG